VSETHVFLGGFYLDQTGVWNGDLIVVSGSGGVWRVTASTNATKVAQINDPLGNAIGLEGALSVPNDPAKYGPWAGKILTCAEATGLVFAIDTNGVATPYNLGATEPEDVLLIPSGQLFYMLDAFTAPQVNKVAQAVFASFAGDVLLVNELVSLGQCSDPALYIVHWDGGRFVVQEIPLPGAWEHATFAPIDVQ